eukprot:6208533-Pleurochrysis_carterae.AAC.1
MGRKIRTPHKRAASISSCKLPHGRWGRRATASWARPVRIACNDAPWSQCSVSSERSRLL